MVVDRERRDVAAHALACYLRHECDVATLRETLSQLMPIDEWTTDRENQDSYLVEFIALSQYDEIVTIRLESHWLVTCRHLAFLTTNRQENPRLHDDDIDDDEQVLIVRARWHALGLMVAVGIAALTTWWLIPIASAISVVLFYDMWIPEWNSPQKKEQQEKRNQLREYEPFNDQSDWLAHQHILEEFHIPPYNATAFVEVSRVSRLRTAINTLIGYASYVFFAAVVLFYIVPFLMILWPVWVVAFAALGHKSIRNNGSKTANNSDTKSRH